MDAVIAVAFCLFGVVCVTWALYSLIRSWQSVHWPRAMGTIDSSRVEESYDSDGERVYQPAISYRYKVAGKEYVSSRRIFPVDAQLNWRGRAEEIVSRYPPGRNVSVSYDPESPGEAVLEPGQYRVPLFLLAFGTLFLVIGLWIW